MNVRFAMFATMLLVSGCTASSSGPAGASPDGAIPPTDVTRSAAPLTLTASPRPAASHASVDLSASAAPLTRTASPRPAASHASVDLSASVVDPVVEDIARLADVSVDEVTVQSAESMVFPDAGLGCPIPGMLYTQVQVDGYKIVAAAAGTTYDYRGTGPGAFRLCSQQQ